MTVTVRHATQVAQPDNPERSVSANAWNADHTVEGLEDAIAAAIAAYFAAPVLSRIWAGAVTDTSFKVCFDLGSAEIETVSLIVGTSEELTAPGVGTVTVDRLEATPGLSEVYYPCVVQVSGLTAGQTYWYVPVVDGEVISDQKGRVRTFAPAGDPMSFKVAFGSCSLPVANQGVWEAIRQENAHLFVHMGDLTYADPADVDPKLQRTNISRLARNLPYFAYLMRQTPIAYTYDDHDFAPNDGHWDSVYGSRATYAQIGQVTRQVVRETTPIYPTAQDVIGGFEIGENILAQKWDMGRVRFLMPDCRSQRRYEGDTAPTMLGHDRGHEYWDQFSWLVDELEGADADGVKLIVLISSPTWTGAVHTGWQHKFPGEQSAICDAINAINTPVVLWTGDAHEGAFDDGTYTDFSAARNTKFPQIMSSPLAQTQPYLFTVAGPFSWGGEQETNRFQIYANLYGVFEVIDNGGDDFSWSCSIKGAPFTDGAAALLGTITDSELGNVVQFSGSAERYVVAGEDVELPLVKTGFGPVNGCSVEWEDGATTGVASFRPNAQNSTITLSPMTDGTSKTVAIQNPAGCTIGTLAEIDVFAVEATPEELAFYNALPVASFPSSERRALFKTLIEGLISDDVYSRLDFLFVTRAENEDQAILNLIDPAGAYRLTRVGSPTFAADEHITGGALSAWETGFVPGTSGLFKRDDHCFGIWSNEDVSDTQSSIGQLLFSINPESSGVARLRSASDTTDTISESVSSGMFTVVRDNSANYRFYKDTTLVGTITRASAPLTYGLPFWLCGWNTEGQRQYSTRPLLAAFAGSAMNDTKLSALRSRLFTYLNAISALGYS